MTSKYIVARQIINKTGKPFSMYEESSGCVLVLIPSIEDLPPNPSSTCYYVVDESEIAILKKAGRSITDIAYVKNNATGANGLQVSYLRSAIDDNMTIRLQREMFTRSPQNDHQRQDEDQLYIEVGAH